MLENEIKSYFDKHITFDEPTHKYTFDRLDCISVTGITKDIKVEFDSELVAWDKAKRDLKIPLIKSDEDAAKLQDYVNGLIDSWAQKGNDASHRGTGIHRYLECHFAGIPYDYDYELTEDDLRVANEAINILKQLHIVPYALELIIGSKDHRLCGTIDFVGKYIEPSPKAGQFVLMDWKTNKGKDLVNPGKYDQPLKKPLWFLKDNHNTMYSLQLNLYDQLLDYSIEWWKAGCEKVIVHLDDRAKFIKVENKPYAEILLEKRLEKVNGK